MNVSHPDYALLAGRLVTYFIHKDTDSCYYSTCLKLYNHIDNNNTN